MRKRWNCLSRLNNPDANLRMKYESTNDSFPSFRKGGLGRICKANLYKESFSNLTQPLFSKERSSIILKSRKCFVISYRYKIYEQPISHSNGYRKNQLR